MGIIEEGGPEMRHGGNVKGDQTLMIGQVDQKRSGGLCLKPIFI